MIYGGDLIGPPHGAVVSCGVLSLLLLLRIRLLGLLLLLLLLHHSVVTSGR